MRTQHELLELINISLEKVDLEKKPAKLYAPIRYVLSIGGKRLRPVLCLMACELYDDQIEKAIQPALALEVFHNFTLLHDDIMDKAEKRRNMDCVHIKWNENVAILSGDSMQILSYQILSQLPEKHLKESLALFTKTAIEVCEGQQFDMDFETQAEVSIEEYMNMIRLKTAVLLAASLKMGGIIGGASEKDAELLYQFGIETGFAFQLKDDLLDVYGDAATFGKKIGGDILCNKKTFLLIEALHRADQATRKELHYWLDKTDFIAEEKIKAITDIYNKLGIKDICCSEIEKHQKLAFKSLNKISASEARKAPLTELANELMDRKK
ncbi:MAG: polyprenyl synthetase family protein [Bacteroidales bacterium]|nr:polyprenyl synthetase family protein [Bacteroidales bacterium]